MARAASTLSLSLSATCWEGPPSQETGPPTLPSLPPLHLDSLPTSWEGPFPRVQEAQGAHPCLCTHLCPQPLCLSLHHQTWGLQGATSCPTAAPPPPPRQRRESPAGWLQARGLWLSLPACLRPSPAHPGEGSCLLCGVLPCCSCRDACAQGVCSLSGEAPCPRCLWVFAAISSEEKENLRMQWGA